MERTGDAMKLRVLYDLRALRLCNPPALQLYLTILWPAIGKRSLLGFLF